MLNLTDHLELLVSLENSHDRMYIAYLITRDILCERISAYADLVVKPVDLCDILAKADEMKIAGDVGENLRKGASKLTLAFYRHKYGSVEQQWSEEETFSIAQDALELYESYFASEDAVISIENATQMSEEEFELAKDLFAAYNAFRKARGIHQAIWDDEMSRYAYGAATGCAATGVLSHGIGTPAQLRSKMSDLLQYSTWLMTGKEAVQRWSQSDGHKKMMQCTSTAKAGAAVIRSNDKWYYVIVYDFVGFNQSA